jgi:hypothetical protein
MQEQLFELKAVAATTEIEAQYVAKKDIDRLKTELTFKV